jgi:hypothetical protein
MLLEMKLAQGSKAHWSGVALDDIAPVDLFSDHVLAAIEGLPQRYPPVLKQNEAASQIDDKSLCTMKLSPYSRIQIQFVGCLRNHENGQFFL